MKSKFLAGVLALFLGTWGIHRFYLGQTKLGILYFLLSFTGITFLISIIDALIFFTKDEESFDYKYNRGKTDVPRRYPHDDDYDRRDSDYRRGYREQRKREQEDRERRRREELRTEKERIKRMNSEERRRLQKKVLPFVNPFRQEGVQKFKEYDYLGAIKAFEKALEMNPQDIAVHFNLACTYSLMENMEEALKHLDHAVAYGFKDFEKIRTHDALAWLRIQSEYDTFEENKFRLNKQEQTPLPSDDLLQSSPNLLDQLKKLSELRQRGLLTEAEFMAQKKKLMG